MLSAFQSRESGFGVKVSRIQLEEINEARRGQNYVDLDAALAVHGQVAKKDLQEESTFVVSFELGANNEGTGLTITCLYSLRTVSTASKLSIRTLISFFCSIIHRDTQKSWQAV